MRTDLLHALFDNLCDGVVYLTVSGDIVALNASFARMHGYMVEEMLTMNLRDIDTPEATCLIPDRMRRILAGESLLFEVDRKCKNGSVISFEVMANLITDDDTPYILAVHHDITERKRKEMALRESEAKYRNIVETAHEGIWILDASAITSYVNSRMAQMLGYTAEEMLGRHLFDFMDADGRIEAEKNLARREKGVTEIHDFRFSRKDGTDMWVIVSTNPILDDKGQYVGALGMITDITEHKKAHEELEAKNIALREVLKQLEVEKKILQENVKANIEKLILPILEKLKTRGAFPQYVNLLQRSLEGIASSFGVKISEHGLALSPKEIEISNMVRGGCTNKEIAEFSNCSVQTVEKHRKNIRKKLRIARKKINLSTHLQHLSK